ncbi:hypothetical protein WR25_20896 [Diploscapter pachys]|uniref:Uncharacterized protein n=1 Tax=Diploscapter pachys TaxID=2018661 RepID=A0A2A2L064_9BILA|nr:hypothetical protein WR25_20896 [Diploscapter pachys]
MSFFSRQQHRSLRLLFFLFILGFWEPSGWILVNAYPDCFPGEYMNSWGKLKNTNPYDISDIKDWHKQWRICAKFNHSAIFNIPENCEKNVNLAAWEEFLVDDKGQSLVNIFAKSPITFNMSCTTYFPEFFKSIATIYMDIDELANENDVKSTECFLTLNDNSKDADRSNIFSYFPHLVGVRLYAGNSNRLINDNKYFKGPLICGNMIDEWRLNVSEAAKLNWIDEYRYKTLNSHLTGCKEDPQNPNCPAAPSTQASTQLNNQQGSTAQAAHYGK